VPDVQPTAAGAHAVAATVHALVQRLAHSYFEGEPLPCHPTWRIAENRWSALRDGTHGRMADLVSGEIAPTEQRLHRLIDDVEAFADGDLDAARALVTCNGADQLRRVGLDRAEAWLCEVFAC
jgi:carboxylate-amine ligase